MLRARDGSRSGGPAEMRAFTTILSTAIAMLSCLSAASAAQAAEAKLARPAPEQAAQQDLELGRPEDNTGQIDRATLDAWPALYRGWHYHADPVIPSDFKIPGYEYKAGGHPSGLDSQYAHKISLIHNPGNDTFYLYYCAVGNKGRCIGLLTSRELTQKPR